ncbi:hypothetical protein WBP07_20760 (plasmid) [Novosphingobium sp. BL-8A]|uniref:hypothetical protein n=1 Tax=Novosphingobium sp. BL-8A TaxID=3127639 RepID=UPI0037582C4E
MNIYALRFSDDGQGVAKRLEFKADDLNAALVIARREAGRRNAELLKGTTRICTIRRPSGMVPPHSPSVHCVPI